MERERERAGAERTDIDAVVVPVTTGHVLVDIGVDSSHFCDGGARVRASCWRVIEVAGWWCREQERLGREQRQCGADGQHHFSQPKQGRALGKITVCDRPSAARASFSPQQRSRSPSRTGGSSSFTDKRISDN